MRVIITGRHVEVTTALRRYIENRMKRLERYGLKLGDIQVVLAVEKYRHTAEVILPVNGAVLQGKASTTEMYASVDQLFDKVGRQLQKRKEKLINHKVKKRPAKSIDLVEERWQPNAELQTIRPQLSRLTMSEAVERLASRPSDLLVFQDSSTGRIQVIRRLEDGRVELIDPQTT
jgi:putative sigma-54 modulation protein